MQKIERSALVLASTAGGTSKDGSSSATSSASVSIKITSTSQGGQGA